MRQYNLKLTPQQAEALQILLKVELAIKEKNLAKKLLKLLMHRIYKRLRNHCEDKPNKAFGMGLTEEVETAFYCYFQFYEFEDTQIYERGFIQSKLAEIDRRIC